MVPLPDEQLSLDVLASETITQDSSPPPEVGALTELIRKGYTNGRRPLFILGAGISFGQVPLLSDIGMWLKEQLSQLITKESDLWSDDSWMVEHAALLGEGQAGRRQTAELFTSLQTGAKHAQDVWRTFSAAFLKSDTPWPKIAFRGVASAVSTPAHAHLADLLLLNKARIVSLNFDGLTIQAAKELYKKDPSNYPTKGAISLHSESDLFHYFATSAYEVPAAVVKIRGDVFYATCKSETCPGHRSPLPIERVIGNHKEDQDSLICPICQQDSLVLTFSFPGFRKKEELAHPMLWAFRRFVAANTACVICIGFSGKWDKYLLDFLFDMCSEREIPLVDVRPPDQHDHNLFDDFRSSYFPNCPAVPEKQLERHTSYTRILSEADPFMHEMHHHLTK